MPSLFQHGQWLYYVGSKDRSYLRITPTVNMAAEFDISYPGHNKVNFWDFFFPNLVENWEKIPEKQKKNDNLTVTPFYYDAAGSGYISSFFYPLWTEGKFAGAIGLDFNLKHIVKFVNEVKLIETGFAFMSTEDGNIIGINSHGSEVMGLKQEQKSSTKSTEGVSSFIMKLSNSNYSDFSKLKFPLDDNITYTETDKIGTDDMRYLIVLKRMLPLNYYYKTNIKKEHTILGFVVPTNEIYAPLLKTQKSLKNTLNTILINHILIGFFVLLVILFVIYKLSGDITKSLSDLVIATKKLQNNEYDVEVKKLCNDEVGQLSDTFNEMVKRLSINKLKQDALVDDRTKKYLIEKENAENALFKLTQFLIHRLKSAIEFPIL